MRACFILLIHLLTAYKAFFNYFSFCDGLDESFKNLSYILYQNYSQYRWLKDFLFDIIVRNFFIKKFDGAKIHGTFLSFILSYFVFRWKWWLQFVDIDNFCNIHFEKFNKQTEVRILHQLIVLREATVFLLM